MPTGRNPATRGQPRPRERASPRRCHRRRGAQAGVLIRNAEALETLERVDTLVVDKTGTLTEGKPRVVSVSAASKEGQVEVLRVAASLERGSEHPLAAAIVSEAEAEQLKLFDVQSFQSVTGKGVTGMISGKRVALGNEKLLDQLGLSANDGQRARAEERAQAGETTIFVAVDQRIVGMIGVADRIKESSADALAALRADGVRVVMVTGDNRTTADAVARRLGLEEVIAGVLPNEKSGIVSRLQSEGRIVAMAGDGINDAPALAQANVGIAMGTGTDIAMESAGITLVKGDMRGIVRARKLSRVTMRNIRQNLFFAFVYNAVGVPLAAGVLYPVFGLLLSPMIASAAMTFSSVSVIANALRLRKAKLE